MAHDPETREAVRAGYVFQRLTLEQAAGKAGVGLATARRWKSRAAAAGDDWDKARATYSLSGEGASTIAQLVLADFLTMYQATVEAVRDNPNVPAMDRAEMLSRLADAFQKTMSAVAKAAPELGRYAVAGELLGDLATFVAERYPQHMAAVHEIMEPFAVQMARKYGG
ncbi:DUF1804 family protein [Rhodospirillum sp. A1_3_36]|uniref:DUF1804 family protein n=1 Tax=Rhodospirillum sp. A1_3_36 TaxID=3391666 RepID=UPI0039A47188